LGIKLIIAGGRDYTLTQEDYEKLDAIPDVEEIISGGAPGADAGGEMWAWNRDIALKIIRAEWHIHGRAAGPIRNKVMAEYADAVALFPGGRGTASMKREAQKADLVIYDYRGGKKQ